MAFVFEQQARESDKAFAAFSVYLSQGAERSLAKAGRKVGKSLRLMETWSRKFDWPARVVAYNSHMALVEREAAEALARVKGVDWVMRKEEQREEEWQTRCELVKLARTAIERWKARGDRCGSLEGIARLLELASKLGRLSSGLPTEVKEVNETFEGKLEVEWEVALKKVYGEAVAGEVVDVQECEEIRNPKHEIRNKPESGKLGNEEGEGSEGTKGGRDE